MTDTPNLSSVDPDTTGHQVDFDLDAPSTQSDHRAQIPPLTVRLGGKEWTLQPPDMGLVMELEEATTTRGMLSLIFDDQWPAVKQLFDQLDDPEKVAKLLAQYGRHFEIDQQSLTAGVQPNRSDRRRARRGARR